MTDNEVKWMIVGKLLRRNLMAAKGEPVAYLYNGVRLPKLPETDLPYKVILEITSDKSHLLLASPVPFVQDVYFQIGFSESGKVALKWGIDDGDNPNANAWIEHGETTTDTKYSLLMGYNFTWSNHDVYHITGHVQYDGTDPVPAYE